MFDFWREATATSVPGFLCLSGRRRPENVSILSSLLTTTATAAKKSLKKWIRAASNFIVLIPIRPIRQMLANFSGAEKETECIKVQEKEKKVVVFCSRSRQNVKLGTFTLQSCRISRLGEFYFFQFISLF